jgi:hypothetical protein
LAAGFGWRFADMVLSLLPGIGMRIVERAKERYNMQREHAGRRVRVVVNCT